MITVFSEKHALRDAVHELSGGALIRPHERPERAEFILRRVRETGLGDVLPPDAFGADPLLRVHAPEYLRCLEPARTGWVAAGHEGEAIPETWVPRGHGAREPASILGRLGYFAASADSSITEGTWAAVRASADVALTAQGQVAKGARAAFALCRPPGHHAFRDLYGGYCFVNNAAVAAQAFRDQGAERVAVLDVDFHHGNGTQSIFYARDDVLFLSLHGDPREAFPYYAGHADETGAGDGDGFTVNYPLPPGTGYDRWGEALDDACERVKAFAPQAVVVSLGVDTYREDPISFFTLDSEDFLRCGARIARLGLPTLFVMEGGYAVEAIGVNTVNVLTGFEQG